MAYRRRHKRGAKRVHKGHRRTKRLKNYYVSRGGIRL